VGENGSENGGVVAALRALHLIHRDEAVECRPLTGGVSSDIFEVVTPSRRFCVKRALPRLKVAAVWEAPVERNAAEAAWMRTVGGWFPNAAPALLAEDRERGLFAMDYFPPATHPLWKTELLDGIADRAFAAAVGGQLGAIHRRSAGDAVLARQFSHDATFEAIRIEPYLRATGRAHPDLQPLFDDLATRTTATKLALVHGDVSPKNILHGPHGPVFLDAECACYGDPAFDLAFCLNHLLLKGARRPDWREAYLMAFEALASAYLAQVGWETPTALERRCATLLPALLLARIDGKSPVEYLDEEQRASSRDAARGLLRSRPETLDAVAQAWSRAGA